MNVLLVDDEPVICKSVGDFLRRLGHQVATALSGEDAQRQLADANPDVVISDVRMTGMTGLDLLTVVRNSHPNTPVVLITGHGNQHLIDEAIQKGAFDFLHKPLELDRLVDVLDRMSALRPGRPHRCPTPRRYRTAAPGRFI